MYTPINSQIFNAAYCGALAGMGASDRVPTNSNPASYTGLAAVAGVYAQRFDVEWNNAAAPNALDVYSAQQLSESAWQQRAPIVNAVTLTLSTYTELCAALVAMILAGKAYYAAQGIVPPPIGGGSAVYPPVSWNQAAWFIDPSNTSGFASNANDGLTLLTPLLTYAEVVKRWGTFAPELPQNTVITFMSDQIGFTDPLVFRGIVTLGNLTLTGVLTPIDTSTFTAVTVQNRTTGQKWQITDGSKPAAYWAAFEGYFIHDTTSDAWFWVDGNIGASSATITPPMAVGSIFVPAPALLAVSPGDAYTLYTFPKVFAPDWNPTICQGGFASPITHLWLAGPGGIGADQIFFDSYIFMLECRCDNFMNQEIVNGVPFTNNWLGGGGTIFSGTIVGGSIGFVFANSSVSAQTILDGDVYINSFAKAISGDVIFGAAYWSGDIDIPNVFSYGAGKGTVAISNGALYGIAALWGPGNTIVHVGGEMEYTGSAAACMLKIGTLSLDGVATASNYDPTTGVWVGGVALSPAQLDAALPGGFAGIAYGNLGSKIRTIQ